MQSEVTKKTDYKKTIPDQTFDNSLVTKLPI